MTTKVYPVTIYTQNGALQFHLVSEQPNFDEALANAMEQGTAIVQTLEGTTLILNAINVVAIEIGDTDAILRGEKNESTPPIQKL